MTWLALMRTGDTLEDRFDLRELLGEGGMGEVYLAWDRELDRRVAIKLLLPQLRTDPRAMDEMKREVRLSQQLQHPNIVSVHDFRVHERVPYIVMEYVEGQPLSHYQYARPDHRIPEAEFLDLAGPILDAVAHAHDKGVVHRDLKPSNLMVLPGGEVKLLDFGIAATAKATYTRLTGRGTSLTPHYAAPEQINGEAPSQSMDIYALGCVFYEMLAGHPPFQHGDVLHQQLTREAPRLEGASDQVADAIHRCLEKVPEDRFGSAQDVLRVFVGAGRAPRNLGMSRDLGDGDQGQERTVRLNPPVATAAGKSGHAFPTSSKTVSRAARWLIGTAMILTGVLVGAWFADDGWLMLSRSSTREPVSPGHGSSKDWTWGATLAASVEAQGDLPYSYSLAISPDGTTLAVGGHTEITIWDVATGSVLRSFAAHTGSEDHGVDALDFSPGGRVLASLGLGEIKLWEVATGRMLRKFSRDDFLYGIGLQIAPGGNQVMTWDALLPGIRVFDVATGGLAFSAQLGSRTPDGPPVTHRGIGYLAGPLIFVVKDRVRLLDGNTGRAIEEVPGEVAVASAGGEYLLAGSRTQLTVYRVVRGRLLRKTELIFDDRIAAHHYRGFALDMTADGVFLAVGLEGSPGQLLRVADGSVRGELICGALSDSVVISALQFAASGKRLVGRAYDRNGGDQHLCVWEGHELSALEGQ